MRWIVHQIPITLIVTVTILCAFAWLVERF